MDIKRLLQTFDVLSEGTMKSAEKHEQSPEFTGYWKGTDKATPGKKMVGGESIIPQLAKQAKADTVKNRLVKEFEQFKEAQEEFVLYIDGKPASKYINHQDAHRDLEFIRNKYPQKQVELKQEICNLKTLPEGKLPDEYELKQPQEQSLNDVLFQTAAQAMVNASREGSYLDTEDAIKQASQVTKIPYVPSQLPALYAQLQKLEQQIASQKQVRKNQLSREKEKLTHQTSPEEERRSQEFMKQREKQMKDRLTLRSEDLEEADVKPVSATVPIQKTQIQPKQTVHVPKENPAAVIDINKHWARGNDGFEGEIVGITDNEYTLSDGHQNRVYQKEQVTILESRDLEEFAPPALIDEAYQPGIQELAAGILERIDYIMSAFNVPQINRETQAEVLDELTQMKAEARQLWQLSKTIREDSELHFKNSNPQDVVKVDVPLLIRLLEYAREDAKTDMDLHNVAERLIKLSAEGDVLSMDQYDAICGQPQESNTLDEDSGSRNGIIGALTRRIMHQHQDALLKYGPERMLDAISAEADNIGDVEELGTSDISIAVDNVLNSLRLEDTVEDPVMKQPVPEEQLTELGADNPQLAKTQTTQTTQTTDPKKAAEIVQTNKNLQALKPALAAAGVNIDVNKMTQTMAKSDIPGAKLTGTEQQVASQLTPGIADALKDQQAAQMLKQAIQKGQQAQK